MSVAFADTWFFIALLDERDADHDRVVEYAATHEHQLVTTRWVLAELAGALSDPRTRGIAADFLYDVECAERVQVIGSSDEWYDRGLSLYRARPDKEWSLADCVSIIVMQNQGITHALTGDHHFTQAGFIAVFEHLSS